MILTGILRNTRHIRETFYLILYHDADFKSHLTLMPADCSVIRTETFLFRGRMEITMKETDKRLEANRLVKLRIARALTKLMEKKALYCIQNVLKMRRNQKKNWYTSRNR